MVEDHNAMELPKQQMAFDSYIVYNKHVNTCKYLFMKYYFLVSTHLIGMRERNQNI